MPVTETELPGVGKKHEIDLGGGETLVVLTHNSGRREVYKRPSADADSEKLFELTDQLARTVGTVLEGAYFQPVESPGAPDALLPGGALIEWFEVDADSPLAGETLGDADLRAKTGASVVTIQRGDDVLASPGPETEMEVGDTLIVVGDRESVEALEGMLARPVDRE